MQLRYPYFYWLKVTFYILQCTAIKGRLFQHWYIYTVMSVTPEGHDVTPALSFICPTHLRLNVCVQCIGCLQSSIMTLCVNYDSR